MKLGLESRNAHGGECLPPTDMNWRRYKPTQRTEWAEVYEKYLHVHGLTVQEFEEKHGLAPYTLYPWARGAKDWSDRGVFMYRNATDEERNLMGRRIPVREKREEVPRVKKKRTYKAGKKPYALMSMPRNLNSTWE